MEGGLLFVVKLKIHTRCTHSPASAAAPSSTLLIFLKQQPLAPLNSATVHMMLIYHFYFALAHFHIKQQFDLEPPKPLTFVAAALPHVTIPLIS